MAGIRRAIRDDDKVARRADILAAAGALYAQNGGRVVTMTEVAARAGVAKGTIYLYFATKEEIYVACYEDLIVALLASLGDECEARTRRDLPAAIVDTICAFVDLHPEFLQLASLLNGVLEPKLTEEAIYAYKMRVGAALLDLVSRLTSAMPTITFESAARLLLQTYAFALGLWQQVDLPPVVVKLLDERPALSFYRVDFGSELRAAVEPLWRDALAVPHTR